MISTGLLLIKWDWMLSPVFVFTSIIIKDQYIQIFQTNLSWYSVIGVMHLLQLIGIKRVEFSHSLICNRTISHAMYKTVVWNYKKFQYERSVIFLHTLNSKKKLSKQIFTWLVRNYYLYMRCRNRRPQFPYQYAN